MKSLAKNRTQGASMTVHEIKKWRSMLMQQCFAAIQATTFLFACQTVASHAQETGDNPSDPSPQAKIIVKTDGRDAAVYNAAFQAAPDPKTPWFGRSGFIDPVRTPSGIAVTSGFPPEHEHQHGLMFAWTSSRIDGKAIDFWNSAKQVARVEHHKVLLQTDEEIRVQLHHIDQSVEPEDLVINEIWQIFPVAAQQLGLSPEMAQKVNVFDLVSTQFIVTTRKLTVAKYHYGAMCVRGPNDWMKEKCSMDTDQMTAGVGESREAGNHTRPQYVVMHGEISDQKCGLAAISHPSNFRAPQPVRLHPSDPYFCFAPMVLGDFQMPPLDDQGQQTGAPYVSAFRFIAFDGPPNNEVIAAIQKDFSDQTFDPIRQLPKD